MFQTLKSLCRMSNYNKPERKVASAIMEKKLSRRDFLWQCGQCTFFLAGLKMLEWTSLPSGSDAQTLEKGFLGRKLSPYFTPLDDGLIRCELCPRLCEVEKGKRGYCRV